MDVEGTWRRVTLDGASVRPDNVASARAGNARAMLTEPASGVLYEPVVHTRVQSSEFILHTMAATELPARLAELQGPPPARCNAAAFIGSELRTLATLRAAVTPRRWQARAGMAGVPLLTKTQWIEADALLTDKERVATVSAKLYEVALAIDGLRRNRPTAWARLAGTDAATTCACVEGNRCGLHLAPGLNGARYQQCVQALPGLQASSWRREPDATRGATTDEAAEKSCYCVCGTRCATALARELHWARCEGDGRIHGLPPDERKRVGAAWLLIDESTGRVLRAGCVRLPATRSSRSSRSSISKSSISIRTSMSMNMSMSIKSSSNSSSQRHAWGRSVRTTTSGREGRRRVGESRRYAPWPVTPQPMAR